ncbi:mutator type transposase [Tanacetum coccineum]
MLCQWRVRKKGQEANPYEDYREFPSVFWGLDGFKAGGRDFLGLDGCFLSGPYPGQILTAVGVDPNNGIYPLAYDVVESESKDSWNILLNNLCEVLNRQLLDGRDKPIITCLEYIREYLMKRIVNVQKVQDKCDGPLTPSTAKIFKLIVRAAAKLKNGSDLYQVTCPWSDQFVVNLSERVCSCRKWELSGIPCTHAVASIWGQANNGIDTGIPESYCLPVHWLTTWKEMYNQ